MTMPSDIRLVVARTTDDLRAAARLRWEILRAPWQQPYDPSEEAPAPGVTTVIAQRGDQIVGVGRLHRTGLLEARIRSMAVLPDQRRRGIGAGILQRLLRIARNRGLPQVWLHARTDAQALYRHAGFEVTGPAPTLFDTIPHVAMARTLDCADFSEFGLSRRAARDDDGPEVTELVYSVLGGYGLQPEPDGIDADLRALASFYRDGFFDVLCDNNARIVGSVALLPRSGETCELRRMYLLEDWRGRGVGQACLGHALAEARQRGFSRMILETAGVLREALLLYEQAGFEPIEAEREAQRCDISLALNL